MPDATGTAPGEDAARPETSVGPRAETPPITSSGLLPGMAEIMRLTRAGKLAEATALIRRGLAGAPTEAVAPPDPTGGLPPVGSVPPIILPQAGAAPAAAQPTGQLVVGSYTGQYGTRGFKLYIPSGYTGQALPLVVMLHGCSQTPDDFAIGTRMNGLAEARTFFAVYPAQPSSANGSQCWNWFRPQDQRRDVGEPSLLAGITRQVMAGYRVDPSQVYVAGISAGAAMSVILGVTYPDLYAAVGAHSGLAYGAARDLPSAIMAMQRGGPAQASPQVRARAGASMLAARVPLIVFHGDGDTTVNVANADRVIEQWLGAASAAGERQVGASRGRVPGGYAYTRFVYHGDGGRAVAEKWIVHQQGHAWSGGHPSGSFTDPRGPDATAEMVRFFGGHARQPLRG
jgi:poly(hydroxyalkanoate) depolymerase family esterase